MAFRSLQSRTIDAQRRLARQSVKTSLATAAAQLEEEEPQRGYRMLVELQRTFAKERKEAYNKQYQQSFQRWCTVLAANDLNKDQKATGSDMSGQVGKHVDLGEPYGMQWESTEKKIPGVLLIQLDVKLVDGL